MEISSGDNAINENDMPIEPHPTWREVLKAVLTINKYIADFNNPIACKLESLLGSFNWQLWVEESRKMNETFITDFFFKIMIHHGDDTSLYSYYLCCS